MNVEYIRSKLALLPQFEVVSLGHRTGEAGRITLLNGLFSEQISKGDQGGNLFLSDLRFIDGHLLATNTNDYARTIEVSPHSWSDISEREMPGTTVAFFGNYDLRRLKLILDPQIDWTLVDFRSRKAVQSFITGTDGKPYRKLSKHYEGTSLQPGESVVDDLWDHEHCLFCWNKIDYQNAGYNSQLDEDGEWVCKWCYVHAVAPHNPRPLLLPYSQR